MKPNDTMAQKKIKINVNEEDGQYGQAMGRIMEIRSKKGAESFMNKKIISNLCQGS